MIHLEKVKYENVWELLELSVAEDQKSFVATNTQSIVEAYLALAEDGVAFPFGVYDDKTPVGFLMIGYGVDDAWENPPQIAYGNYNVWRLMIDQRYQGRGFGRQALELALEFIRSWPCGEAEYCYLSYAPENSHAKALYNSMGFFENGETDQGEIIAVKKL